MSIIGRLNQYGLMLANEFNEYSMSENLIFNSSSTAAWNVGTFVTETTFPIKGLNTVRVTNLSTDGDSPYLSAALITSPGFYTVSHFIDTVNSTCTAIGFYIFGSTVNGNSYASTTFTLSTKTCSAVGYNGTSWSNGSTNVVDYGNGIYRVSLTAQVSLATTATRAYVNQSPPDTSYALIAGSQYESGTVATDYTPTTGTAITRTLPSTTNTNITNTGIFYGSGFEENTGFTNTLVANIFSPYDVIYDEIGGTLVGPGQGRYMRSNSNKNVIVYNEIDEVADFRNIVRDGLVLDLDGALSLSYPGIGTTWKDLGDTKNNATLVNGVGYSASNNGSLTFDGSNDYCILNTNFFNNTLPNFTISCWFNKTTDGILIGNHYHNSTWESVWFSTTQFTVNAANNNTTNRQTLSYTAPSNSVWHNLVAINNSSAGVMKVFLNGVEYASLNATVIPWNSSIQPTIGAQRDISTGGILGGLVGNIRQIITYNRVLSNSEITQNYNAIKNIYGL